MNTICQNCNDRGWVLTGEPDADGCYRAMLCEVCLPERQARRAEWRRNNPVWLRPAGMSLLSPTTKANDGGDFVVDES